ncbi:alpha/beta hydrolase [Anaerotruncus colihominis]|uniref:alpha/beta hydrolase n=1 Tax=Anaerotruncus colihominis TaxID=169435 RepID=UPI0035173A12
MINETVKIRDIPAVLYGGRADRVWLYVHGKSGCKEEGEPFAHIVCPEGWQVLAIDLPEHGARLGGPVGFDPWHAVPELRSVLDWARRRWPCAALRATSLGAWFSMLAFAGQPLEKALFVSPVLDMELLICDMMRWAGVDEQRLRREGEIATDFGETLSWRYLAYAREHPIARWDVPTEILYAGGDNLTRRETVDAFACRFGCGVTVMEDGDHWFHTPEQLAVLEQWTAAHME